MRLSIIEKRNNVYIQDGTGYLIITRLNGSQVTVLFDPKDINVVKPPEPFTPICWRVVKSVKLKAIAYGYKTDLFYLHREIMRTPADEFCASFNGDYFDLRRSNLRNIKPFALTKEVCKRNTSKQSKTVGVGYDKRNARWYARVWNRYLKRNTNLGDFKTEELAVAAIERYQAQQPPKDRS